MGTFSLCVHVAILVSGHLGQAEDGVLALQAMIVSLFAGMLALYTTARLARRELLKARRRDTVQFRVLPPVGDHLVRVCANEIALETMEVGRLVLHRAQRGRVRALRPAARHVCPVLLEIAAHQGVETLVPRRVLNETRLVAERVAAVLTHAVEVRLMLPVTAVGIPAVLVESEPEKFRDDSRLTIIKSFIVPSGRSGVDARRCQST